MTRLESARQVIQNDTKYFFMQSPNSAAGSQVLPRPSDARGHLQRAGQPVQVPAGSSFQISILPAGQRAPEVAKTWRTSSTTTWKYLPAVNPFRSRRNLKLVEVRKTALRNWYLNS